MARCLLLAHAMRRLALCALVAGLAGCFHFHPITIATVKKSLFSQPPRADISKLAPAPATPPTVIVSEHETVAPTPVRVERHEVEGTETTKTRVSSTVTHVPSHDH